MSGRIAPRLARRAVAFAPSVWNEAFELVARYDDVIYFGNGAPASEIHPIDRLQQGARLHGQALSMRWTTARLPVIRRCAS